MNRFVVDHDGLLVWLRSARNVTLCYLLLPLCLTGVVQGQDREGTFARVSPRDPRYFELSDGRPYIPIGLNMIAPPGGTEKEALAGMDQWLRRLSENGGNFIRLWLSNPFFDVEHTKSGVYDGEKAGRIKAVLAMARQYDIRVKMTLEHFRHLGDGRQRWAGKSLHAVANGGPTKDIADFFANPASREQFKTKLDWYAKRFGDDPTIFAWELWNEFNAVQDMGKPERWQEGGLALDWTRVMLEALHERFPKNLALQSLGSFDDARYTDMYRTFCLIPGNDVAQVHRYLDLGARLEVCHEPMDVLTADAVTTLLGFSAGKGLPNANQGVGDPKPILLAESGAVEPGHSGPFKLYDQDKAGILLHDVLFAPFFAGAAGPGHCWHWDSYVARNDLWWQFGRFAQAVKDIDPPAGQFRPLRLEHPRLRIYALAGRRTFLAWCRDTQNTWQTELAEGKPPENLKDQSIRLPIESFGLEPTHVRIYDPWADTWAEGTITNGALSLPAFSRSIVFRIEQGAARN